MVPWLLTPQYFHRALLITLLLVSLIFGARSEAYGCNIALDDGCKSCVPEELRVNNASCASCNNETFSYYVENLTCKAICTGNVSESRTCTCPVGKHGSTTLVGDALFGGCHANPTSIEDWIIKISSVDDAVVYNNISSKIMVKLEKSGGRTHEFSLFKDDCITAVPNDDLLRLAPGNGELAGVNTSNLKNEFVNMVIDVNLSKMENSSLLDKSTSSVHFCVRVDLKDGPGVDAHGVSFIRARISMQVKIVANIRQVSVQLDSSDQAPISIGDVYITETTENATNGTITLKLADVSGLSPGMYLTIFHNGNSETRAIVSIDIPAIVVPASRRLSQRLSSRRLDVPGTVTLDFPLQYAYPAGVTVEIRSSLTLTHVIELDACQCGTDVLDTNARCVARSVAHIDIAMASPPKLTPSDRLSLCISTQTDVVEIHGIENLKLTQSQSGLIYEFDAIKDSSVSGLASYSGLDKKIGHIHRVQTNLVNDFFKNTGSGAVDQADVTVSGTARVYFKPSRRLALANVVIKRSLQDQAERGGRFSMTVELKASDDVEAPTTTVAPTGTAESSATTVVPKTAAETSTTVTSAVSTFWGYEVKSDTTCANKAGEVQLFIPDGTDNLKQFCAGKCNITGTCVGFVFKGKEAMCRLRLSSMYAPTHEHGMSCYVRTNHDSVRVSMRVENMEYSLLMANPGLLNQFVKKVKHIVAKNAGNGVSHKDVEVGLSPGSIQVEASVHAYSGLEIRAIHQALSASTNMNTNLVQSLQSIPGIDSVSTGPIAVSNFQAVLRSATIPFNQTPKSKESDEFNWVLFALIPGATLACVLFLVCCVTWSRKVKKQNRKDKDRRQLAATSHDEESQTQKQEDCKLHMANAKIVAAVAPTEIDLTFDESTSFNVLPGLEATVADRNRALPKLPTFARDSIDLADEKCFDMPQANFEDASTPP